MSDGSLRFCPAIAAAVIAISCIQSSTAKADGPVPSPSQAQYEINFMEGMITHHAMAVEMGMLCGDRAVHEELLALCEQIIAAQSAEIDEMQSWLEQWYGISYEPVMTKQMERQLAELASFSGEQFEIAFLEMMIKHHSMAVTEGGKCLRKAYHDDLIELCGNIVQTQTEEIELMESWLCEWYGGCD